MSFPPAKETVVPGGALSPSAPVKAGRHISVPYCAVRGSSSLTPCAFCSLLSYRAFMFWSSFLIISFSRELGNRVIFLSSMKKTLKHWFFVFTKKKITCTICCGSLLLNPHVWYSVSFAMEMGSTLCSYGNGDLLFSAVLTAHSDMSNCDKPVALPWWLGGKELAFQCRTHGFDPWAGKNPWRRKWQPTPVFLLGKFPWQRSPTPFHGVTKELDMTCD